MSTLTLRATFLAATVIGTIAACGGTTTSSTISSCVPGTQSACPCAGGGSGVQVCNAAGAYGTCACADSEGATSESSPPSVLPPPSKKTPPPPPDDEPTPPSTPPSTKTSACAGTSNVLVLDGDQGDYIHPGYVKIAAATQWQAQPSAANDNVALYIDPTSSQQGLWWHVDLAAKKSPGQSLAPGAYLGAERAAFRADGKPGIDIGGDGRGCNTISGSFWVEEITWDSGKLAHLLAAFEQHCEGGSAALRGCVRYDAP